MSRAKPEGPDWVMGAKETCTIKVTMSSKWRVWGACTHVGQPGTVSGGGGRRGQKSFSLHLASDTLLTKHLLHAKS